MTLATLLDTFNKVVEEVEVVVEMLVEIMIDAQNVIGGPNLQKPSPKEESGNSSRMSEKNKSDDMALQMRLSSSITRRS